MPTFKAQLWKRIEDMEGELTIILKVPLSDYVEARQIPVMTELDVEVSWTK
jgi:hypothetical protein